MSKDSQIYNKNIRAQKNDKNGTVNNSCCYEKSINSRFSDLIISYQFENLFIYIKSWVIFIDYSMQHLVPKQKFTYHYIDFLQMKESLKKVKSLKTRKKSLCGCLYVTFSSFSVLYHLLLSLRRFSKRIWGYMRNKNYQPKVLS